MNPTVVVVGLGPAGDDLVTVGTRQLLLDDNTPTYLRTRRHPAAAAYPAAVSFDDVYEAAATMDDVYTTIVDRLVEVARDAGRVVYGVPGSPLVAERTVRLLLADDRVQVEVQPAMSFLDLAWVRLGVDPIDAGVRVVDGHSFSVDAAGQRGPLMVCQCDSPLVLSDLKLAVEEWPDEPVIVLQRLGLPDERVAEVAWEDLDREVDADHLTSVYIPSLLAPIAAELVRFQELVQALRQGCPWDRQQSHDSLKRYLLEECYELLEAIDGLGDGADDDGADEDGDVGAEPDEASIDALCEELGDVLFQVFFHATIAAESGWFTLADVARVVHDKLRDRHPHVFGNASFTSADELAVSWEASKQVEKSRASVMEGIPAHLPALLHALKVQKKATTAGYDEEAPDVRRLVEAVESGSAGPGELGELLFGVVAMARAVGIDPEDELRRSSRRFVDRFERRP